MSDSNLWLWSRPGGENMINASNPGGWEDPEPQAFADYAEFCSDVDRLQAGSDPATSAAYQVDDGYVQQMTPNTLAIHPHKPHMTAGPNNYFDHKTPSRKRRHDQLDTPESLEQNSNVAGGFQAGIPVQYEQPHLSLNTRIARTRHPSAHDIPLVLTPDSHGPFSTPTSAQTYAPVLQSYPEDAVSPLADRHLQVPAAYQHHNDNVGAGLDWQANNIYNWVTGQAAPLQLDSLNPENPLQQPGLRQGIRSATSAASSFTCVDCDKEFPKKSDLDHHCRYHLPGQHQCPTCERTFHFPKDLRRHLTTHNSESRIFLCRHTDCDYHTKGFKRNDHLERHYKNVHKEGQAPSMSRSRSAPLL